VTAPEGGRPVAEDAPPLSADAALVVDVEGFEGPLDLLLALARAEKLDLERISILALVEQYLAFISRARRLRIELAADYLVMAAWLAYLKSRLLLPPAPSSAEPSGEELAEDLAHRLRRLEAMRRAAARLSDRPRLGLEIFARGGGEPEEGEAVVVWSATLYDLLTAYAAHYARRGSAPVRVVRRGVWTLAEARAVLERLVGPLGEWIALDTLLARYLSDPADHAGVRASSLAAALELAREGRLDLRQSVPFAPLFLRPRPEAEPDADL